MEADEIERLAGLPGRVISCGGGAVLNEGAMRRLKERSIMVWLWAGVDTILKRTERDNARPLLNIKDGKSEIEKILSFRKPYYAGASDLFMRTDDRGPEEIAERICYESSKFLAG
jgi:shikimate kinase